LLTLLTYVMFLQGMNSKRSIAICLSTRQSGYQQMLHDKVGCNVIYSKPYGSGTLYALMLHKAKTHVTLDNALTDLDAAINMGSGGTGTWSGSPGPCPAPSPPGRAAQGNRGGFRPVEHFAFLQ
jgi:hypothetical protein